MDDAHQWNICTSTDMLLFIQTTFPEINHGCIQSIENSTSEKARWMRDGGERRRRNIRNDHHPFSGATMEKDLVTF
jgi:hypothetical protein